MTTEHLIVSYLGELQRRNRSPRTIITYERILAKYLELVDGDLLGATVETMAAFTSRASTRPRGENGVERSSASCKLQVDVIRSLYRWMHEKGHTSTNRALALHGPTVHNVLPKAVPEKDWMRIWESDLSDARRAAFGLGYFIGMRRFEVLALTRLDVNARTINIHQRKGGQQALLEWREIYDWTQERLPWLMAGAGFPRALHTLCTSSSSRRLIPWSLGDGTIIEHSFNRELTLTCEGLGIPHYTPHQLRHSAATNLLASGLDVTVVSRILGHSNIQTTMRYLTTTGMYLTQHMDRIRAEARMAVRSQNDTWS